MFTPAYFIRSRRARLTLACLLAAMACTCSPAALLSEDAAPETPPAPDRTGTPVSRPPAEVRTPESFAAQGGVSGLTSEPAWLIVGTTQGIWAANQDGSSLVAVFRPPFINTDLLQAIQPNGRYLAMISSGEDYTKNLALEFVSLPDGRIRKITNLTTPDTEPAEGDTAGDDIVEATRAMTERDALDWSPDGSRLAFLAALEGPKSEVYVYDIRDQSIRRISDTEGQAFSPAWSPDGEAVLYFAAEAFGTGAGAAMTGAYLAAADGSGSRLLYAADTGDEALVGWNDDHTAVVKSWTAAEGPSNLRLVDVRTGETRVLQPGTVHGAAVAAGWGSAAGTVFFGKQDGLYVFPAGGGAAKKLSGRTLEAYAYEAISWREIGGIFIVRFDDGSLFTYPPDGADEVAAPFNISAGQLGVAAYGMIWGWTDNGGENEGAWISGPGMETVQIFRGPAVAPNWNVSNDLFFFSGTDLYRSTFDRYYEDTGVVGSLEGIVYDAVWMGWFEAYYHKYGE